MAMDPTQLTSAEYAALRATIRERGTARLLMVGLTVVAWAALVAVGPRGGLLLPVVTLLVLASGFELVFAMHVAVERIGRYIQHYYGPCGVAQAPAWEHVAMALGQTPQPATPAGPDPLAAWLFTSAAVLNLVAGAWPVAQSAAPGVGLLILLVSHGLFLWRLRRARRFAAGQRERDLEAIKALRET